MVSDHGLIERQTSQDQWGGPSSPPLTTEPKTSSLLGPESQSGFKHSQGLELGVRRGRGP